MNKSVLITGGTGRFGNYLVKSLLRKVSSLTLLVRAGSQQEAEQKVKIAIEADELATKIKVLRCDLNTRDLGLNSNNLVNLANSVTHILHAAATTRFNLSLAEARRNNVDTTRNLLHFAYNCKNLIRIAFFSTAFIAGKRTGNILEEEFEHKYGFLNTYEESKYEAENLVRQSLGRLPLVIFRPSLILTPSKGKSASPIGALNLGLFLLRRGFLPILPGNPGSVLDIVEGDFVVKATIKLLFKPHLGKNCYHLTSSDKSPVVSDLILLLQKKINRTVDVKFCGDMKSFNKELDKIVRFRPDLRLIYKKTESFLPELAFPKRFDNSNLTSEIDLRPPNPINSVKSIIEGIV